MSTEIIYLGNQRAGLLSDKVLEIMRGLHSMRIQTNRIKRIVTAKRSIQGTFFEQIFQIVPYRGFFLLDRFESAHEWIWNVIKKKIIAAYPYIPIVICHPFAALSCPRMRCHGQKRSPKL